MKKLWLTSLFVALLVIAMSASAFASKMDNNAGRLSEDDLALGGVVMGMTQDDVASIYGQPDEVKDHGATYYGAHASSWNYGNTFEIRFENEKVYIAITTANNGIQTPEGVHVGSPVSDVWTAYGKPWFEQNGKGDTAYWYHTPTNRKLIFTVKNHKVIKIYMGYED